MQFLYPVPKTNIVTQTYQEHVNRAKAHGWCYQPGNNCTTFYFGGIDWAVVTGTPVRASQDGIVDARNDSSGYGKHIRLTHKGGYKTIYGHMSKLNYSTGDEVNAGDVIGLSGNTGNSTGPHLHFETRKNESPFDPAPFLVDELDDNELPEYDYPHGVDVSHHNGVMDWNKAKNMGIYFAIVKATEGDYYTDDQFSRNYSECIRLGIPLGAYHYVMATVSPSAQLERIKSVLTLDMYSKLFKFKDGTPLLALDCEGVYSISKTEITSNILTLSAMIKGYYGNLPIIYTNADFCNRALNASPYWKDHKLWVASWYVEKPTLPEYWTDWYIWQYGIEQDGEDYGANNAIDVNYMKDEKPVVPPTNDHVPELPEMKPFKVIIRTLNMRKGPSTKFAIAGTLQMNEVVYPFKTFESGKDVWLQVGVNQWVAYYYNKEYYLEEEK